MTPEGRKAGVASPLLEVRRAMAAVKIQEKLDGAIADLQAFVEIAELVAKNWESGDLAGAVRRLTEWSEVVQEKYDGEIERFRSSLEEIDGWIELIRGTLREKRS